jgi:cytochrome c oxidase subunit 1
MSVQQHNGGNGQGHAHDGHGHHELPFWRKYIFSVDHKVIGIQYAVTALFFLLVGFSLMMIMRWQLAYPGQALPVVGKWLGETAMPGGVLAPEFYRPRGARHGTMMVFLGVVPLAVGGFGNFVVPLQIGAPDMAFPRLNMVSYWVFFPGCVAMVCSFFLPGGAAQSGWTSYPPLSDIAPTGQTAWLFAMVLVITSSLLGSINFIVTIVHLRAKVLSFWRLPFLVPPSGDGLPLLLAFPPLEVASVLQIMHRLAGTSFFLPSGSDLRQPLKIAGGGTRCSGSTSSGSSPTRGLRPVLPAMGIVAEVIANNTAAALGILAAGLLGGVRVHICRLGAPHVHDRMAPP